LVLVGVRLGVGVSVTVGVRVMVGVLVIVGVRVTVGVFVNVGVYVGVSVGVLVFVLVGLANWVCAIPAEMVAWISSGLISFGPEQALIRNKTLIRITIFFIPSPHETYCTELGLLNIL